FAANGNSLSTLRPRGNFQRVFPLERRHLNFRSEGGLRQGDGDHAVQIIALARVKVVLFHLQDNVQVSSRPAENSGLTFTLVANPGSVFNSGRNFYLHFVLADDPSFTATGLARIENHLSGAAAGSASSRNAEESLLKALLPAPAASIAGNRLPSTCGAGSMTRVAGLSLAHRNFAARAEDRVLQFDGDVGAQIGSALCPRAPPASAAEDIAESKEIAEDFAQVLEGRGIEAAGSASHTGVAKTVILRALSRIGKNPIRLAGFFELFFGSAVAGIEVRMMLHGELPIGALQLLLGCGAADAEDLIIVTLHLGW